MGFRKFSNSRKLAAWERFVGTGVMEPGVVGPEVEASWRRCRALGVDPHAGRASEVLAPEAFAALAERKRDLIRVAKHFMENLYRLVDGSSFVVLLFDEHGHLLETVGDPVRVQASYELNLEKGALWSEAEVGTNGAGTPLILGRPFQVSGPEHFCRKHHRWTCSGAPIFDAEGRTIGLLDMTGPVDEAHLHTLGLVMAAVEAIQHELALDHKNRELSLMNTRLGSILATVTDGIVVLGAKGRVSQINPMAERLLGVTSAQAAGKGVEDLVQEPGPIQDLLAWGHEFLDRELELSTGRGAVPCLATGKPILDEAGVVTGAVLFVNPLNKIKRLINRFNGAQASFHFEDILGHAENLKRALQLGRMAAASESNVLLTGESGTGKEMFAQSIHNESARRKGPFVAVNCGAIPRELIASELFGYQDGAFTGAARGGRPGKFELASGGTLFLDEIGDMPLEQQIALLRVLQDRTITRLGGDRAFRVDVRIICATHKDLLEECHRGTFRQDLYYRLNVAMIKLPPLREHGEDIPLLLEAFLQQFRPGLGVGPGVVARLQAYPWPGNIREFQNVVERMAQAATGPALGPEHVPEEILGPLAGPAPASGPGQWKERLEEEEKARILAVLRTCKGNMTQAARELGMARNTLYRKVQKF